MSHSNENKLQVIVENSGLEITKAAAVMEQFKGYFDIAAEWETKAKAIVVTDASQKEMMEAARKGRLFLRDKRIAIENNRKVIKEQALREGKAIDGIANVLKALIAPIEEHLAAQENFVEIKAQEAADKERKRLEEKAEKKRIAENERQAKEQEELREENKRLKKKADVADAKVKKIRDEAAAVVAKERAKLQKEKKEADAAIAKKKELLKKKADAVVAKEQKAKDKIAAEKTKLREQEAAFKKLIACPKCHHKFTPKNIQEG